MNVLNRIMLGQYEIADSKTNSEHAKDFLLGAYQQIIATYIPKEKQEEVAEVLRNIDISSFR